MSHINKLLKLAYSFEKKIASSDEDSFDEEQLEKYRLILERKKEREEEDKLYEERSNKQNKAELDFLYQVCNNIENIINDMSDGSKFETRPDYDSYYGRTYVIDSSFEKLAEARLILTEALNKIKEKNNF